LPISCDYSLIAGLDAVVICKKYLKMKNGQSHGMCKACPTSHW